MLELAIAEAYRPLPRPPSTRPPSFATNPSTRASAFSLRSRPSSALSRNPSTTSHPRSFRNFIARRKRPDSVLSERTEVPEDAARSDSVLNSTMEVPETHAVEVSMTPFRELPGLPPKVALPPQEELEEFDVVLQEAVDDLQTASLLLGRDLATMALGHLAYVADIAACIATDWPEFWGMLLHAAMLISSVLPAWNASAKNMLVRSLAQVARRWNEEQSRGGGSRSTAELARIAGGAFDESIQVWRSLDDKLGVAFAQWMRKYCEGLQTRVMSKTESRADSMCPHPTAEVGETEGKDGATLRILTLSTSPAVLAALSYALSSNPQLTIDLSILSSSNKHLLSTSSDSRVHITTNPTHAVGTASQKVDILLLEADCIDSQGDVRSNKGALGTAVCVKTLSPSAKAVVMSGVDSITSATTIEGFASGGDVGVAAQSFEMVPARFVDVYIAETGAPGVSDLARLAKEADELERYIFGEHID
ncbi:hypothetical protein BU25DRAFT_411957 [Macroventuria anomochaeta]|uniref:Uncharacterized protein n=1 Tax=Macroventuria anomochaeta TaxID=301207 RepID=A0ACB6RXY4_9PLEO|nr:uncharacterized protein BU25DRAFT_411957 [Macroventuria anomochaeta]KAF2626127.1 hypothetical protein BU25DRAFT_411957 [Macroventuria anomochaeta]